MSARTSLAIVLLIGCGGGTTSAPGPDAPSADPGPDAWSAKTFEEKHARMTFTFHPNMARRFQRFRQSEYPTLACITCHGDDAERIDYRMPADLPPLDPEALPTADDSAIARFMVEVVVPEADRLMQAGGRVTCFSCHPRAGGAS